MKTLVSEDKRLLDKEALNLALDPALLYRIKKDLDRLIVGENENKLLLFMIAASSLTDKPMGAIITGESSAGKSHLMNRVLSYFDNVFEVTRMTEASPDRLGTNFKHKILKVEELHGAQKAQSKIRVWISEGKLRLLTTVKDEDGNITTDIIETDGIPVFITTTTSVTPDEELLNRIFILSVDETPEQTRAIVKYEAQQFMEPDFEDPEPDPVIKAYLQKIQYVNRAVIPYANLLAEAFPCDTVKARRDFKKLLNLIYVSAVLHQYQRPILCKVDYKPYVVALPQDFYIVWRIAGRSLGATLYNLQERMLKVLRCFESEGGDLVTHTSASVAALTGYSQNRAREILNNLVNYGFLTRNEEHKPYIYSLVKKPEISTINGLAEALQRFTEEDLKNYLNQHARTTKKYSIIESKTRLEPINIDNLNISHEFVDPCTGDIIHGFVVVRASQSKQDLSVKQPTEKKTNSDNLIVEDSQKSGYCWVCGHLLPADLKNCTVLDGRYVHLECYHKAVEGLRRYG